jgi:hypothetical protein
LSFHCFDGRREKSVSPSLNIGRMSSEALGDSRQPVAHPSTGLANISSPTRVAHISERVERHSQPCKICGSSLASSRKSLAQQADALPMFNDRTKFTPDINEFIVQILGNSHLVGGGQPRGAALFHEVDAWTILPPGFKIRLGEECCENAVVLQGRVIHHGTDKSC